MSLLGANPKLDVTKGYVACSLSREAVKFINQELDLTQFVNFGTLKQIFYIWTILFIYFL